MKEKPKTPLLPSWSFSFSLTAQPINQIPILPSSIEDQLKARNQSFYGAVFNAFDDYLRRGHAFNIPPHHIKTDFLVDKDDAFYFQVMTLPKSDASHDSPDEAVQAFFYEIYNIVDLQEIEGVSVMTDHNKAEDQTTFTFRSASKYELLQIAEDLLKPYDMTESFLPSFQFASQNAKDSMPFSLFAQYSLKHIRAMYMMTQGRTSEVQGIHLNH